MKRIISIVTAAVLSSAGMGSIAPAKTSSAASELFTHQEWTGKAYTDKNGNRVAAEDVFAINREAASVNAVPYQSTAAAVDAVWDYNAREKSDYLQMLTGKGEEWQLTVVQNASRAQKYLDGGFMNSGYKASAADGWKNVELPKSWTCQGFDFPIYANVIMPWQSDYNEYVPVPSAPNNYNPVGLYRKTFTVDSSMRSSGRRVYIQFDGVESAYYVYVNGKEVGYSEDTFSPHRFDITDYLNDGENTLAVEVHKFCDGTWFEGQDMIYDGGIFRDVFLVSTPGVRISDYTVRTDLDESFKNAELQLKVDISNITNTARKGWTVQAEAYDESGKNILGNAAGEVPELGSWQDKSVLMYIPVNSPKLWSAEDPNLYALVLTLKDENGKAIETVSTQLGFREINFTSTQVDSNYKVTTTKWDPITINGKRLVFKGVNRHDTDPFNGKAVPQEVMEEDIRLMQENNINSIRTSHYSNDSYLYWLCNKYGMYVMGETNMEAHALMNDNDAKGLFKELGMDRTETAFKRLKNNPSIVTWSIGNEMAYTSDPNASNGLFRDMIWYFKKNDPTRPVHSEGQGNSMGVDMSSNMYPGSEWLGMNAGSGKIPYVMCEYDHAMGNSLGALKEYWDVVRSGDNMLGGFIWDWCDQSRAVSLDKVNGSKWDYFSEEYAHKNLYSDEIKGKYYAYGGDWGDKPNDNSFCQNGIVSPDRDPQPEIAEVKFQYQNFWFSANDSQIKNHEVSVYNENNFTDLSAYKITWELLKNGVAIDNGVIADASCSPLSKSTIKVPFKLPASALSGDEFYLNISVFTKTGNKILASGKEISYAQFKLDSAGKTVKPAEAPELTFTESDSDYIFAGQSFNFTVSKSTGIINKYGYNGEILMSEGPTLNFWRGYVENDNNAGKQKLFDTNWQKALENIRVDSVKVSDGENGSKIVDTKLTLLSAGNTKADIRYTIKGDGSIKVDMSVDAASSGMGNFLRVGSIMTLPEGSESVSWYGNGPVETFNDRKTNGRQGIWSSTVSEMFYPYMKADDTGNLTDVKWISVKDSSKKSGLLIAAEGTVEASTLHFRPSDLQNADHPYKLSPRKETILSVDYGSMGTGSATCGQGTLGKYQLPSNKAYSWSYTIMPVSSSLSDAAISDKAAKMRSNGISIQDKSHNNMVIPVGATAQLKETSSGNSITGALEIPFNGILNKYVEGKNSFTIEANIVPTGDPEFNMFAGKGDSAFAVRTRQGFLDFFIYANGNWRSLYCKMSTDAASGWVGKKHQVAGIYDAEKSMIYVYCDGKILGEQKVDAASGVAHSDYSLTIGACPETGRSSQAEFYDVRLYSKALSAAELASQNTANPSYKESSEYVQLWLDFDNIAQGTVIGDVNSDGEFSAADLVMLSKWIHCSGVINDGDAGDLNGDGILDIFDLCLMRKLYAENL